MSEFIPWNVLHTLTMPDSPRSDVTAASTNQDGGTSTVATSAASAVVNFTAPFHAAATDAPPINSFYFYEVSSNDQVL